MSDCFCVIFLYNKLINVNCGITELECRYFNRVYAQLQNLLLKFWCPLFPPNVYIEFCVYVCVSVSVFIQYQQTLTSLLLVVSFDEPVAFLATSCQTFQDYSYT